MRRSTVDLRTLTPREREVHLSGYRSGYSHGLERGRELRDAERDDEEERAWQNMADRIRRLGGPLSKPYSAMCELRNDPERAAAARLVEQALGVSV